MVVRLFSSPSAVVIRVVSAGSNDQSCGKFGRCMFWNAQYTLVGISCETSKRSCCCSFISVPPEVLYSLKKSITNIMSVIHKKSYIPVAS